jgi:hypothetical protein
LIFHNLKQLKKSLYIRARLYSLLKNADQKALYIRARLYGLLKDADQKALCIRARLQPGKSRS